MALKAAHEWCPHVPTAKQAEFLNLSCKEALYGGGSGGGKSDALLMAALQHMDKPGYRALLLRRTYADLSLPEAIMDRAKRWLMPHVKAGKVTWNDKEKIFRFPSGATLTFGYLDTEGDKYRYQSAEFQFIGFDELTQFLESQYTYLFSRLRRPAGSDIPLRMRSATNPGGIGHGWVKERFISNRHPETAFIPALLADNPHLDHAAYRESLKELDPFTRKQLEDGLWDEFSGGMFVRSWFDIIDELSLPSSLRVVRAWDLAATAPKKGKDPDYTVGVLMGATPEAVYIIDVQRTRDTPGEVKGLIRTTADLDRTLYPSHTIYIEEEGGSSGKFVSEDFRNILRGFHFYPERTTGKKTERAKPFSSYAFGRKVKIVRGPWNKAYLDELELFPLGAHDDQVDASSLAFLKLVKNRVRVGAL